MASSDTEKQTVSHNESDHHLKEDAVREAAEIGAEFTPEEQKAIIRRIDRRLVVTVGILYCVSLMDRTNLSAASIAGMQAQLRLDIGNRYSLVSLIFFVPYILAQAPSTVIVRKIGPRIHMAAITLFWGAVMIGMGFAKSYKDLIGMRVILGVLEAGFFPSAIYLLSTWYTRYELGKRNAIFYVLGCVASAFAGVLAAGLMQMSGKGGLLGWSWIFIWEGIITCGIAMIGYWLLVDFPDGTRKDWKFLSPREKAWIVARVNADRGDVRVPPFTIGHYLRSGLDWKVWAYAMLFFNSTTVAYALAYFLPIILVGNMGFGVVQAQCLMAPPYVFAGFVMFLTGHFGDRYKVRGPFIVINMILCMIGLPIVAFHKSAGVRYFGVFLVAAGTNSNVPVVMSYQANNIRGQWKRAFASASMVGFGGIGGIAGSLVFRSQDSPTYKPGIYACMATCSLNIVLVAILSLSIRIQNGKADRGEKELETSDPEYQPGFRYTY